MTFCQTLKEEHVNGYNVQAVKETEPEGWENYYIYVCRNNSPIAIECIQTARTTWKKKLAEIVQDYA